MEKNKIAITLGIVCVILTIAICVQIKTVNNTNTMVAQTFAENSLRDEVLKWQEKYDNISKALNNSEKTLDKIRTDATKNDSTNTDIEKQITLNNNLLGMTNLVGKGIEVTVKDSNPANIGPFDDISELIVHDADLRRIVNDLKNAGAEAISINGQRLVNSTAITCIRKCDKSK